MKITRYPRPPDRAPLSDNLRSHGRAVSLRRGDSSRVSPLWDGLLLLASTVALAWLLRAPWMPYNVRELGGAGFGLLVSAAGLTCAIYWMASGPFAALPALRRNPAHMVWLPLALVIHGIVGWCLLRIAVPMESIHDIVGSPILYWSWECEQLFRYLALHTALSLQVIGGILLVRLLAFGRGRRLLMVWLPLWLLLGAACHLVVVQGAATDNLTEMMRGGGSLVASALLALGFLALTVSASCGAVAALVPRRRVVCVLLVVGLAPLAYAAFSAGTEPLIYKYGKLFSAFQFLLSTDRERYASGLELLVRYSIAHGVIVIGLAVLQLPGWFRCARADSTPGTGAHAPKQ